MANAKSKPPRTADATQNQQGGGQSGNQKPANPNANKPKPAHKPAPRGAEGQEKQALIITTDHGRGYNFSGSWRNHGRSISGSDHIWYITNNSIPGIFGENKDPNQFFLAQVADQIKNRLLNKSK